MNKKYLNELKEELLENMNGASIDFINDYDNALNSNYYLSDIINEFADNSISVYYSDQFNAYEEDPTAAEDSLLELYDGDSIIDIIKKEGLYNLCCKAGVCYEYKRITGELYEDEDNIKKLFIINYLLDNDIPLTREKIDALLIDAEGAAINRTSELKDIIDEYMEE